MAIRSKKKLANYISNWIKEQAKEAGATSLVVGISGGVDSALVAALCARTGMRTVGVRMPCQSSPSSLSRADEVIKKFNLKGATVDLAKSFSSISSQLDELRADSTTPLNSSDGALRSCLRAPTLDYVSKLTNGIIIGTGNRDEDEVTRYFQKRGDGCVDISPIAKLHKSEVYELSAYLGVPKSVLLAVPTADLWGPDSGQEDEKELGLTYAEVERGIRLGQEKNRSFYHGCSYQVDLPRSNVKSYDFLEAAKNTNNIKDIELLTKLAIMELKSRHKTDLPVCVPPELD